MIRQPERILLGMKKRGFGMGHWNGFGGKVEPGEDITAAAEREVLEEAGITVNNLEQRGILNFEFENEPDTLEVHVFTTDQFVGEPTESDEMRPQWFSLDAIPQDSMWPDDPYWLPLFLAGKCFIGSFKYHDLKTLTSTEVEEVPEFKTQPSG